MLNNLFKPSVSRSEHDRAIKSFEDTLAIAIKQRDKALEGFGTALEERDEAQQEHANAVNRELKAIEERDEAIEERDEAIGECNRTIKREEMAREQIASAIRECTASVEREVATCGLFRRALVLLNEVDPSRTGGKQLRKLREVLFSDAMLAGLWGELPKKED